MDMEPRAGSDVDRDALAASLRKLDFEVTLYEDLTVGEINVLLQDCTIFKILARSFVENVDSIPVSDEDHTDRDCLLIAVLTHGDDGGIIYARDRGYKAENLWSKFTSDQCPTLAGKPKLFFIQVVVC